MNTEKIAAKLKISNKILSFYLKFISQSGFNLISDYGVKYSDNKNN
jgi:hypothetical protein